MLAAAWNVTEPSPEPVAPWVTVIHGTPADDVHAHPSDEITAIMPVPPLLAMVCDEGEIP